MVQHESWSSDRCDERHRGVGRTMGVLLTLMGLMATFVGWTIVSSNAARSEAQAAVIQAQTAAAAASLLGAKNDEYRDYMKQDMKDVKASILVMSGKQDRMNESVQRLLQKSEIK